MHPQVPAVVILGQLNGLGIVRSLGCGHVQSYVVDRNRFNPGMWSRYSHPVLSKSLQGRELIDGLLKLRAAFKERPVLFNSHEMAVLTISKHRRELEDAFRFCLPKHETLLALQDKARFHELATSSGLPVPRGAIIRHSSDIEQLRSLHFPVVIKPGDKELVHTGKALGVVVFGTFEQAAAGCAHMLEHVDEIIAQQWVDGGDGEIHFCLFYRGRNGAVVSMFTGRKLASSPRGIGLTAFCTAAPEAGRLLEPMTRDFLEKVDYFGMGSVEYKWDVTNRRFVIIEPTVGRTDWQEENRHLMRCKHSAGRVSP